MTIRLTRREVEILIVDHIRKFANLEPDTVLNVYGVVDGDPILEDVQVWFDVTVQELSE